MNEETPAEDSGLVANDPGGVGAISAGRAEPRASSLSAADQSTATGRLGVTSPGGHKALGRLETLGVRYCI